VRVRTVMRVPLTSDGANRLAVELEHAHEVVDPPRLVWVLDVESFREHRGEVHGWRPGATGPAQALIVRHEYPLRDVVEWVCEPYVRDRHE
jgi:hypothetical protein